MIGGGGGGVVVTGGGDATRGAGVVVVGAGLFAGAAGRGAVEADEVAPCTWPAGKRLIVTAREPEVSANTRPIPVAATTAISARMIPSRLLTGESFGSCGWVREAVRLECRLVLSGRVIRTGAPDGSRHMGVVRHKLATKPLNRFGRIQRPMTRRVLLAAVASCLVASAAALGFAVLGGRASIPGASAARAHSPGWRRRHAAGLDLARRRLCRGVVAPATRTPRRGRRPRRAHRSPVRTAWRVPRVPQRHPGPR